MRSATWLKTALFLALCLALCLGAAQAAPAVTVKAEIGYDGVITYLRSMPLHVTLKNDGSDAELVVAVNVERSEIEFDRYEYPLILAGGAEMQLSLPLTLNYKQAKFTVEVLQEGQEIARASVEPKKLVSPATLLVGVLSQNPQSLSYMNISAVNDQLLRGDIWQTVALTQESFPNEIDLLRAFRILAVDGVDVSAFSTAQQEVLQQWLREGGIIILGGGSTASLSLKAFSVLTGMIAGAPYQAQGVDQALLRCLSDTQFAPSGSDRLTGNVMLSALRGGRGTVADLDGKTLIDRCPVEQGVIYTAAFALGEKPLSSWNGMTCFWQRVLLSRDRALYQRIINELNNYYNYDDTYVDTWLLRQLGIKNDEPALPVILLVAAFVLISGLGSYFVLKRLDKREWLWLTVPVLSLACAAALYLLGGRMGLNKPVAASYAMLRVDEEGYTDASVMAGVAAAVRTPLRVNAADGSRIRPGADYSMGYYNDNDEQAERIKRLRYLYTEGDTMRLTLPATAPWEVRPLLLAPAAAPECAVSATVWWEEDGLHGQIINGSDLTLQNGYVLTSLGFCRVPELLPGQKHDFAILQNDQAKQGVILEGELVNSGWQDSYAIVSAALYPEYQQDTPVQLSNEESRKRNQSNSLINACMNRWNNYSFFHYVTFSDNVGQVPLQVDGLDVRRSMHCAVIDVQMAYRVMSDSGLVRLTRGMIPAYHCTASVDGTLANSGAKIEDYAYFNLRDEPVICFALHEIKGLEMDKITVDTATFSCETYGGMPRIWLYNVGANQWEEARYTALPVQISGDQLARFMDAQGQLFMRITPGAGQMNNGEVYNPVLTLEGRSK